MLAKILAIAVGSGSFMLFMAAFFFPEVYRKGDFIWSGIGIFYAIVLWFCAGQATGAELLGETASVVLILSLGGQLLALRRQKTPSSQQTPTEAIATARKEGLFGWFGTAKPEASPPQDDASPEVTPETPETSSPEPSTDSLAIEAIESDALKSTDAPEQTAVSEVITTIPEAQIADEESEVPSESTPEISEDLAISEDSGDVESEIVDTSHSDQETVTDTSSNALEDAPHVESDELLSGDAVSSEPVLDDVASEISEDAGEPGETIETPEGGDTEKVNETTEPIVKLAKSGGMFGSIGTLFGRKPQAVDTAIADPGNDPLEDWGDDDDLDESTELEAEESNESIESTESSEPVEPSESTESSEPAEPSESTELSESSESTEATESSEPVEPSESTELSESS